MENLNKEIESVISELNTNLDNFIKNNNKDIEEIKTKMMNQTNQNERNNEMNYNNMNSNINNSQNQNTLPFAKISHDNSVYYKADFSNYIRNGSDEFFRKSLNFSPNENGGYFLPAPLVDLVNNRLKYLSPMRLISNVMTISTSAVDLVVDTKDPDAGWIGDSEERTETNTPEIQKIKIPVHEIYARPKANQRLLDDTQIDVEDWLLSRISEKIARLENDAFINGDGNDKPQGFLKYETVTDPDEIEINKLQCFKTGKNGGFNSDDEGVALLIDMAYSIKPEYVKNAKWIMSRSALSYVRKLRKTNGGSLWQPSLAECSPSLLLGYPVIIDDDMPVLKDGTPSASIAFGDFNAGYQIVDRQGFSILRDPYTSKPFVEFYVCKRTGGAVVDFDAIKILKFEE